MTLYEFQEAIRRDESDPHMPVHDKIWSMFKIAITSGYRFSVAKEGNLSVQFKGQSEPCNDLNHAINYVRYRDRNPEKFGDVCDGDWAWREQAWDVD